MRRASPILAGLIVVALALTSEMARPIGSMIELDEASTFHTMPTPTGTYSRHAWVIHNVGSSPLVIRTRFTSGRSGFSLWQGEDHLIPPQTRIIVSLTFLTPDRPTASFASYAILRTNDPERAELRLTVVGISRSR